MTRVSRASSHHGARVPATLDRPRAVADRKKKPYKIVLEAVTQEKRKLQSILSYHDQAPPGFGYIPVGHPEFTEWCKEQCRQRNLDVHIVSAKPRNKAHADPDKISHHVHRIGHHFPLEIIELACKKFGYKFNEHRGLEKHRASPTYGEAYFERGLAEYQQRQRLHGRPAVETETKNHIRGAVREIFPKIPEADLTSIVNHAFEEGTDRVGNAKELSLARRVQLAVVAHIRHTYTEYDNILKTGSWTEARQKVEHVSLAKLKEWRDEAGEVSNELEETFREVIVLDDEEEESSDDDTPASGEREPSMEIFHSRATARDLQPEPVDHTRGYVPFVSKASRRTIVLRPVPTLPRSYIPGPSVTHTALRTSRADPRAVPLAAGPEPLRLRPEPLPPYPGRRVESSTREPVIRDAYPLQLRDSDGRLYNLEPINETGRDEQSRAIRSPPRIAYDPRGPEDPQGRGWDPELAFYRNRQPRRPPRLEPCEPAPARVRTVQGDQASRPPLAPSRHTSDQDVVLPSIEREPDGVSSPRRVADASLHPRQDRSSAAISYAEVQSPKRKGFPASVKSPQDRNLDPGAPVAKRLKPVYDDNEAFVRLRPSQADVPPVYNYHPAKSSNHTRVQPDYELIDLTSSPKRMPRGGEREVYEPLRPRPTPGPSNHSYVLAPSREGNMRIAYNEAPLRWSSRAHIPEYDRMYDGHHPPLDRAALREEAARFHAEGDRYYGRHKLH